MLKDWHLIVAILLAGFAHSALADDELGKRLINEFVNDIVTLEGSFVQSQTDADDEVLEQTIGTFEVERPGRFRWATTEPYANLTLADGMNIWNYDEDLAHVMVKPQAEALTNTPALLLGGSADALEQFEYGGTTVESETVWVRLEPRDKDSGFVRLEMGFTDGQLQKMIFFDHLEQTTYVALSDVKVNEPIDAARFEFEAPQDVDVVGAPAVAP